MTSSHPPKAATHSSLADPRNEDILIYINGEYFKRSEAKVSVFDSGFMLGDGVWEGLRLHQGKLVFLEEHLDRLFAGAMALDLDIGLSKDALEHALYETLAKNQMTDGVHVRLMVTRGPKTTPFQDPRLSIFGSTIVIIAEFKEASLEPVQQGISLFTVHVRRGHPDVQDPRLNSHSKINCITAMIQSYKAGADEALMLDPHGFVNTCNSTNFFIVRKGELWTSTGDYCMNGITRGKVIDVARLHGLTVREKNFSLVDAYSADEAFVTGTFGAQVPVISIDGRTIGGGKPGPVFAHIRKIYHEAVLEDCTALPKA